MVAPDGPSLYECLVADKGSPARWVGVCVGGVEMGKGINLYYVVACCSGATITGEMFIKNMLF